MTKVATRAMNYKWEFEDAQKRADSLSNQRRRMSPFQIEGAASSAMFATVDVEQSHASSQRRVRPFAPMTSKRIRMFLSLRPAVAHAAQRK